MESSSESKFQLAFDCREAALMLQHKHDTLFQFSSTTRVNDNPPLHHHQHHGHHKSICVWRHEDVSCGLFVGELLEVQVERRRLPESWPIPKGSSGLRELEVVEFFLAFGGSVLRFPGRCASPGCRSAPG